MSCDALNFQQFLAFQFIRSAPCVVGFFFAIFEFAIAAFDLFQPFVHGFATLSELVLFADSSRVCVCCPLLVRCGLQRLVFGF